MAKRFYAALAAAMFGLTMSCGQISEDAASIVTKNDTQIKTDGVFAQFNAGGADNSRAQVQKIDLVYNAKATPVVKFNEGSANKEEWLVKHELTDYDFIDDPLKLGPKWTPAASGGGGEFTDENDAPAGPQAPAGASDSAAPSGKPANILKEETGIDGPEYTITHISVIYLLDKTKVENLLIPSKQGSEFVSWKISDVNSVFATAEGPKAGTAIIPAELSYTFTYEIEEGDDTFEIPAASLLKPLNSAYIKINAEFKLDERTAEAIDLVEEMIDSIPSMLSDDPPPYEDDNLVGATLDDNPDWQELNTAVQAAQAAVAGDEVVIEVPLDDFERYMEGDAGLGDGDSDPKVGDYKTDGTGALIPLVAKVAYRVYNTEKIVQAQADLKAAIAKAQEVDTISTYVPTNVTLSSRDAGDQDWKSVTIVNAGTYKITISGASGGHAWSQSELMEFGGKGGYIEAQREFEAGAVLKIRIGTEGKGLAQLNSSNTGLEKAHDVTLSASQPGGWPNGGNGGKPYNGSTPGSGGGGATEVYYAGTRERSSDSGGEKTAAPAAPLKDAADLTHPDIILAAGGGGGAGSIARPTTYVGNRAALPGGDAGPEPVPAIRRGPADITSEDYNLSAGLSAPYTHIKAGHYKRYKTDGNNSSNRKYYGEYAPPGTFTYGDAQTGRGANGGTGINAVYEGSGGGGGGYIGGNAINNNSIDNSGGGGGGSNHISSEGQWDDDITVNRTADVYGNGTFKIEYVPNARR
jgi:hypothetical protein